MSHYKFYLSCYSMRCREENEMDDFADRVLFICDYFGITPYQVWKKTNLSKSAFYRSISSSTKNIRFSNFIQIVEALDVPADFFRIPMESFREAVILYAYRELSEEDKKKVLEYAKELANGESDI